jgi:hypothetical protein
MGTMAEGAAVLVDAEETICRVGFVADVGISRGLKYPQMHDPETGLIRLEEISWDDLKNNGFSVQIKSLYSSNAAQAEAARRDERWTEKLKKPAKYAVAGVHLAKVAAINAIEDKGGSAFRVLDTRTADAPAHAEIRISDHLDKSGLLKYRTWLQKALGAIRDATEIDK